MKAAIFYFTMSGNTELAAKEVAEATGAPLVRLHAEPPYTVDDIDWTHPDARCTRDVNFQRFPTLDAKKLVNAPKMSAHHRGICHF